MLKNGGGNSDSSPSFNTGENTRGGCLLRAFRYDGQLCA
jgi:hypothetical protein